MRLMFSITIDSPKTICGITLSNAGFNRFNLIRIKPRSGWSVSAKLHYGKPVQLTSMRGNHER